MEGVRNERAENEERRRGERGEIERRNKEFREGVMQGKMGSKREKKAGGKEGAGVDGDVNGGLEVQRTWRQFEVMNGGDVGAGPERSGKKNGKAASVGGSAFDHFDADAQQALGRIF